MSTPFVWSTSVHAKAQRRQGRDWVEPYSLYEPFVQMVDLLGGAQIESRRARRERGERGERGERNGGAVSLLIASVSPETGSSQLRGVSSALSARSARFKYNP